MAVDQLSDWLRANHVGLLIGALIAGAIVAGLLLVKWLGERARERDPEHTTWPSVLPRRGYSPTCSRRCRSCSTSRSSAATRSATTAPPVAWSGSDSKRRACAR